MSFVLNDKGLIEFCKSSGMQAVLRAHAEKISACANAAADPRDLGVDHFEMDPYTSAIKVLDGTAIGVVFTQTALGRLDEQKNKSLSAQNH